MRTQGRFHCFMVSPMLTDLNYYRNFAAARSHAPDADDCSVNDRQFVIEIVHLVQQGHEFVIEGPLPDDQLKIIDAFTDVCSARTKAYLLEDLFAGRLELIGAGNEGKVLRDALAQRRVSDLTLLDDGDPLKVEALRRLHYVQAVFDERPRVRTRDTLSPIIERISEQIKDENPPSWTTLKRWSRIYERSGEDMRALVPAIKARGNRRAKYSGRIVEACRWQNAGFNVH
jgi:hypothetical protein